MPTSEDLSQNKATALPHFECVVLLCLVLFYLLRLANALITALSTLNDFVLLTTYLECLL